MVRNKVFQHTNRYQSRSVFRKFSNHQVLKYQTRLLPTTSPQNLVQAVLLKLPRYHTGRPTAVLQKPGRAVLLKLPKNHIDRPTTVMQNPVQALFLKLPQDQPDRPKHLPSLTISCDANQCHIHAYYFSDWLGDLICYGVVIVTTFIRYILCFCHLHTILYTYNHCCKLSAMHNILYVTLAW